VDLRRRTVGWQWLDANRPPRACSQARWSIRRSGAPSRTVRRDEVGRTRQQRRQDGSGHGRLIPQQVAHVAKAHELSPHHGAGPGSRDADSILRPRDRTASSGGRRHEGSFFCSSGSGSPVARRGPGDLSVGRASEPPAIPGRIKRASVERQRRTARGRDAYVFGNRTVTPLDSRNVTMDLQASVARLGLPVNASMTSAAPTRR
jgi:hypothetical protein